MTGVCSRGSGLFTYRCMDVREHSARFRVVGQRSAAERLNARDMDLAPHRRFWILELLAGTDNIYLGEARDKHGDVTVPNPVLLAEHRKRREKVVTMVEGHTERTA